MYDKAGSVLRVETTIAKPDDFMVFRPRTEVPDGKLEWLRLRKGVADLYRRMEVSQNANNDYLDALSVVEDTTPCSRLFDAVARPVVDNGRRFRALRIGDPDELALLAAISRGDFATAGFRNREIRQLLHPASFTASLNEQRRISARLGRRLRLLRAHGLIRKVPRSTRYELTQRGQLLTAALHAVREASVKQLLAKAA